MKRIRIAILAGILLAGTAVPVFAEGLLGGLVSGSGGGGLVTIGSGNAGSGGAVNIGLGGGGSSGGLDVNIGGGNRPAANVNVGSSTGGGSGSVLDANIGSGGGGLLGLGVGGQGSSGNLIDVNLLTGSNGGPGTPGQPGQPGAPGAPGQPGAPGSVGMNGSSGSNSSDGFGGLSKITFLARLLENRAWLRFAAGNAVCLPPTGIANVSSLLSRRDANRANQLLGSYAGDIGNLRNLLKKCGTRTISQADINRAVAVDLRRDGTVVLYVL